MSVVIETTLGDITVDLFLAERPRACLNFLKLCKIKYYNYNLFHTISRGFMAQTGDPTGSRKGGESFYGILDGPEKRYFEGENEPRMKHTKMGLISFVGNDDRMIGSQFFITLGEDLNYLDQKHCVFGEVVEGFEILEIINEVICDTDDRPYQDVRVTHTVILDDPYPDPKRLRVPSRSPSPSIERLQGGRIAPDEDIDDMEGKTVQEVAEVQAEREAKARATILEMVGDLPDADMAPPENVLFICKLNPITTDDDLEIIFNRFGKIVSCEVIRDRKTGDSLQYAFIEFEDKKPCEDAYFKMDNILIDDRRIHVDFSQSVSKVKWNGKGRGVTHFDEKGRKTTQGSSDIGKGNYKLPNQRNENHRTNSPKNFNKEKKIYKETNKRESTQTSFSKRKDDKSRSRSPLIDSLKQNDLRSTKIARRSRSLSREKSSNGRTAHSNSRSERYSSRSGSSRRRTDDRRQRESDRYGNNSRREDSSYRRYEESRKRVPDKIRDRNYSSSKYSEYTDRYKNNSNLNYPKRMPENERKNDNRYSKTSKEVIKVSQYKSKTKKNTSSESESEDKKSKTKNRIDSHKEKPKSKKTNRKESTHSESDSSDNEIRKRKTKKKKKVDSSDSSSDEKSSKKKRKKQRKESTSESDDSDSSDTESSESEDKKRKKKKISKKRTTSSSESESSEEERTKSRKKKH